MNADYCRLMARYNRLANQRLYDACAQLDDAERKRDRRAFFRSIHGTLNHLLIGDRIWMTRFQGGEVPSMSLNAILHEDFAELRAERERYDAQIESFFENRPAAFFEGRIDYVNNEGRSFSDEISMLSVHFFNHQTHHRGQVHAMLTQTDAAPPVLDLHRVLKPNP